MRHGVTAAGLVAATFMAAASLPAQTDRPLPAAEAFLSSARTHLASNALLQRRYRYRERQTSLRLNPFGKMGTGDVEVFQVFPAADDELTYRRLVERNGTAIPAAELAKQDRDYAARYTRWQQGLAQEGTSAREARSARDAEMRRKEQAQALEMLGLFDFTLVRREQVRDQPAIVVQFAPRADGKPRSREGRVASAFAGFAWIHETEYQLLQLEGTSREPVAFGFGMIAKLNPGATFRVTRAKTQGVWLPDETRFSGGGRALLVRKVVLDYVRQYSDYQPYDPTGPPPIPGLAGSGKR